VDQVHAPPENDSSYIATGSTEIIYVLFNQEGISYNDVDCHK
jgi:hypothetical protein